MNTKTVHVAVAAIVNKNNQVLISKRPDHVHQGGLWEFPGGKIEPDENVNQALKREIEEEIGISIEHSEPLITINHCYSDKTVCLEVRLVKQFFGEPKGMEGQPVRWENIQDLKSQNFPEANMAIIKALQLPDLYMITGKFDSHSDFKDKLAAALNRGERIVQLRCKHVNDENEYLMLADMARESCHQQGAKLLLNTNIDTFNKTNADGLHLNSHAIFEFDQRPIGDDKLLSISCHDEKELKQAKKIGADIVLLSPVKETSSHPGVPGIGWESFSLLTQEIGLPVYALGGMSVSDLSDAKQAGAQGIAAISALWSDEK